MMTPYVDIEVIGARTSITITALLDTGFDGQVCVPTDLLRPVLPTTL